MIYKCRRLHANVKTKYMQHHSQHVMTGSRNQLIKSPQFVTGSIIHQRTQPKNLAHRSFAKSFNTSKFANEFHDAASKSMAVCIKVCLLLVTYHTRFEKQNLFSPFPSNYHQDCLGALAERCSAIFHPYNSVGLPTQGLSPPKIDMRTITIKRRKKSYHFHPLLV